MNKLKSIIKKIGIKTMIIIMVVGATLLGFLAVAIKIMNQRKPSPGNIDIDQHVHTLEEKINEWQNYLDTTPAPRRR
jgi:hypothetical protein